MRNTFRVGQVAPAALLSLVISSPAFALTPDQMTAVDSAGGNVGALAMVASILTRDAPDAAGEIAGAATSANPAAGPRVASASATVAPASACDAAAAAAAAAPDFAGKIAGAVSAVRPVSAPECAAAVAEVAPSSACEIVALASAASGRSTQSIAAALRQQDPDLVDCANAFDPTDELADIDQAVISGDRDAREAVKARNAEADVFEAASELQEQSSPN